MLTDDSENTQALRGAFMNEDADTQDSIMDQIPLANDEQTDVFLPEPQRSPTPPRDEDISIRRRPDVFMRDDHSDNVLSDREEEQMGFTGLRSARRQKTPDINPVSKPGKAQQKRKELLRSQYDLEYPAFPTRIVKKLASTLSKSKISKDVLNEIIKASDMFFVNVGEDLGALAHHAGRKTIEDSDVLQLMKRYVSLLSTLRLRINETSTLGSERYQTKVLYFRWHSSIYHENFYRTFGFKFRIKLLADPGN